MLTHAEQEFSAASVTRDRPSKIGRLGTQVAQFVNDLVGSRYVIWELAKQDFKSRYMGSYLGILWAFIHPIVTIGIFWFVFENGLKSRPVTDSPFVLWLIAGIVPWFFFSESLGRATNAILEKRFLVKKVVFRVSILPLVKILSALVVHLMFLVVALGLLTAYGLTPSIYTWQLLYYLTATFVLLLGLAWMTSALVVFVRDLGQVVSMTLQFGFWLTPICWPVTMVPERFRTFVELNPLYYIVRGYRESLIDHVWFWQHPRQSLFFWCITGMIFIVGGLIFKRLRPQFADVM